MIIPLHQTILILWVIFGLSQSAESSAEKIDRKLQQNPVVKTIKNISFSDTPPGVETFPPALLKKISAIRQKRGDSYSPRTKHITAAGKAKFTNRLFLESSPYLLQHAHNPVNWYPWGDEAFEVAAKLKRPVLLSVGYSTCHWCHVMEEESFEDLEIATYINENFIAIKVDREERPDIDSIYMTALHALGQGAGWPMNVWLTPDRDPFYGGSYFPARDGDRGASVGLLTVLKKLKHAYQTRPYEVLETSQDLAEKIKINLQPDGGSTLPAENIMQLAAGYYKSNYDSFYGGMGDAPKFPSTTPIQFLLRYHRRSGDKKALNIVELTLAKMAAGGIYDQVGGGFHRYSTDNEWLVPHFEKMLYDNALLAIDYLETYQVTHNNNYKRIVNETLRYIKRDMTSAEGGFYSATDADSATPSGASEEGYFYTWSREELLKVLGKERADIINNYYAITNTGNFEGRNILNTPKTMLEFSKTHSINREKLAGFINESNLKLYRSRKNRPTPLRDEKILVAWNGLMISAYAKAGLILNNQAFIQQALKSTKFILSKMYINGRLFRSYKDGMAKHNAYLDDYAFFIAGLLDLYEATYDIQWVNKAIELDKVLAQHYEDIKKGGFYKTSNDHEKLLAREKPGYDGAEPTGNSVQVLNLLRLGEFTSDASYTSRAVKTLSFFSSILNETPMALSKMLLAVDFYYENAKEIIIITPEDKKHESDEFIAEFRKHYVPNRILSVAAEGDNLKQQATIISAVKGKRAIKDKATAYVCRLGICELPTNSPVVFAEQLRKNIDNYK